VPGPAYTPLPQLVNPDPGANAAGGVWLWIELNRDGTGDYHGSDCGLGGQGSAPDSGSVTWSGSGAKAEIRGIVLNGLGGLPATVTLPATYGHYAGTFGSFITLLLFIPPTIHRELPAAGRAIAPTRPTRHGHLKTASPPNLGPQRPARITPASGRPRAHITTDYPPSQPQKPCLGPACYQRQP
jgi:hypothetical protein